MSRGGKRSGAGRPPGAPNKASEKHQRAVAAVAEKVENIIPEAFEGNSLAYLQSIYKDQNLEPSTRIFAASKAIAYECAKPTEIAPHTIDVTPLAERIKAYAVRDGIEASKGKVVAIKRK